jgi:hypothetical protein
MLIFTIAPLAALFGSATLGLRRSPSGPPIDAQLPFLGAMGLNTSAGSFALTGLTAVPAALEHFTEFMMPADGTLRSLLVKNAFPGDDPVDLVYHVRINQKDVGTLTVRNNDPTPQKLNLSQVPIKEGDLVSLLIVSPGSPGTPPIPKCVLLWRPR